MVAYQRCLHRAWALIALLGLALAGCAYTSAPKKQELRPPTPEEAALVSELREKGVALVVDGCVFGYGPDKRSTVGLRESTAMARQYGEQIKRLLAENGIATNALVYPTVCASHRHLGRIEVAETIEDVGVVQDLPVFLGEPAGEKDSESLRQGYKALFDRVSLRRFRSENPNQTTKRKGGCVWCTSGIFNNPIPAIPTIESQAQLEALQRELANDHVLTLIVGTVQSTQGKRRQDKREDIAKAVATFIFTFGMASSGETAEFGASNPSLDFWGHTTNIVSGQRSWGFSRGSGVYSQQAGSSKWDDAYQRNFYYPLTQPPKTP